MKNKTIVTLLGILACPSVWCAEYDFYIDFESCKSVVGYLVLSNESLKTMPGDATVLGCKRESNIVLCDFFFKKNPNQKGLKGNTEKYEVVIDSPPLLHFKTESGSEYVAIDTTQHAATLSSRVLDQKFLGAKVCQGFYATNFEMKSREKK